MPTGDKTWEVFSHILLHSEGFGEIQGREEPSLQVLDMLHCSREAFDIPRVLDLHMTAGYWWPGRCCWDWWGFGQFEDYCCQRRSYLAVSRCRGSHSYFDYGIGVIFFFFLWSRVQGEICAGGDLGKMVCHQHTPFTEQQGVGSILIWLDTLLFNLIHFHANFINYSHQDETCCKNNPERSSRLNQQAGKVCSTCVHSSLLFIAEKVMLKPPAKSVLNISRTHQRRTSEEAWFQHTQSSQ